MKPFDRPPGLYLHPTGGETFDPINLEVSPARLGVLAALATMTQPAFDVVLRMAMANPMPLGVISDGDRVTFQAFYHTARQYFEDQK